MSGEIGVLCCELIMHYRFVVSVSSRLDLTVVPNRDSDCSQLPVSQLRSFDCHDDPSQAMPRIFCKLYLLRSRLSALMLQATSAKIS